MSGIYGTIRPANINPSTDVEIYYFYRPTRGTSDENFSAFKKLDESVLVKSSVETVEGTTDLMGMYNLRLPLSEFNKKGFYTIYIKPKEYIIELNDVSVLAAYPNVKGVVINSTEIDNIKDLTGYRLEYFDTNGMRTETTRLITSSNLCEPILVTVTDNYPKTTRYKLNASGSNLLFCTLTPSTAPSYKPNTNPYIGVPGGKVALSNTKFNPVMIEVEMIDHDADTITNMLEGDQVRDRDNGIITTYTADKQIYHQYECFTMKNSNGEPLYDVKRTRTDIDASQAYDNVVKE